MIEKQVNYNPKFLLLLRKSQSQSDFSVVIISLIKLIGLYFLITIEVVKILQNLCFFCFSVHKLLCCVAHNLPYIFS